MIATLTLISVALVFIGVPLAFAMGAASLTVFTIFLPHLPMEVVAQRIFAAADKYSLAAVPLFILAGELMNWGGLTTRLVDFSRAIVGWIRGGLGYVTVVTAVLLSGISGSGTADAAALGKILIPAMRKQGYDDAFAASLVASSVALGPIIPPSIVMVVYAAMTNISTGKLFLAGIIPGLVIAAFFMVLVMIFSIIRRYPRDRWGGFRFATKAFFDAIGAIVAPLIIIVGMVGGYFGATEAGAVICTYAAVLGFLYREMTWQKMFDACKDTVLSTGVILFAIAVAASISWIMAVGGLPQTIAQFLISMSDYRDSILLLVIGILLFLGLFLDGISLMVILVPVFVPVATALGLDQLHFAMVIILCITVGAIHPPVGMFVYVACQVSGVPVSTVTKSITIWWFVLAMILAVLVCTFVPELVVWLPYALLGK